jgi:hypothetical protein
MYEVLTEAFMAFRGDVTASSIGPPWTWFMAMHMVNDHLSVMGVTPMALHPDMDIDADTYEAQRFANTRTIWVGDNHEPRRVESRNDVRAELIAFLTRVTGNDPTPDIPDDVGPPVAAAIAPAPVVPGRRVFRG